MRCSKWPGKCLINLHVTAPFSEEKTTGRKMWRPSHLLWWPSKCGGAMITVSLYLVASRGCLALVPLNLIPRYMANQYYLFVYFASRFTELWVEWIELTLVCLFVAAEDGAQPNCWMKPYNQVQIHIWVTLVLHCYIRLMSPWPVCSSRTEWADQRMLETKGRESHIRR